MSQPAPAKPSANKDWLRALQATADMEAHRERCLAQLFDAVAKERADAPALIDARETLTFAQLHARAELYSRWALASGLRKGDAVALLMENCGDYIALWLGLTRVGVVVALLNTALPPAALAHCLAVAKARLLIASEKYAEGAAAAIAQGSAEIALLHRRGGAGSLEEALSRIDDAPQAAPRVTLDDRALLIYTSGTTGLPKAAIVSHRRVLSWALWFKGLIDAAPQDRMYNCLPLYHSVGGVVAVWSVLLGGGSVVLRERFSASAFWEDVTRHECTLFQYIGELCRYLLNAPTQPSETRHRLRLCVGNGLRRDVWKAFQARFSIPRILEFYAATESNFSLYNVEGEAGAIGRVPAFLSHRFQTAIVAFDVETEQPLRDADGRCRRCGADEAGEAIAKIAMRANDAGAAFEGYLDHAASDKKILRDVFEAGDAWMRSGDLMRRDARGFYYFVDRIGDTFRWKGENVSTFEVAQTLAACPGVLDANVYGVALPGQEGRAGMAALAVDALFSLEAFAQHATTQLAPYARPLFLRLRADLVVTETFKHKKRELAEEGFDPARVAEALYFLDAESHAYVALDDSLYRRILSGAQRL
jgi:fatty-acyl-CoA synthase